MEKPIKNIKKWNPGRGRYNDSREDTSRGNAKTGDLEEGSRLQWSEQKKKPYKTTGIQIRGVTAAIARAIAQEDKEQRGRRETSRGEGMGEDDHTVKNRKTLT